MMILPFLLSVALSGAVKSPYPIEPCPLKTLCEEADLIVRARVDSTEQLNSSSRNLLAMLDVKTVLHGKVRSESVEVIWSGAMICPEPARYSGGTSVIAFLNWDEEGSRYSTSCLSYGLKELDEAGLDSYSKAIERYFVIRDMKIDAAKRDALYLDWIVGLAVDPVTRWEGTYELAPISRWDVGRTSSLSDKYIERLTGQQIQRLQQALLATKNLVEEGSLCLVRVMRELGDPDLPAFLLKYLAACRDDKLFDSHFYLDEIMMTAAAMEENAEAMVFAEEYGRIFLISDSDSSKAKAEQERRYHEDLIKFIELMQQE